MQDWRKTDQILSTSLEQVKENSLNKAHITFDRSIDYWIKTELGISYQIEESLNKDIIIMRDQQLLINYIILNGDFKPKGFTKQGSKRKYWENSLVYNTFKLDTLNWQDSIEFNSSTEKIKDEKSEDLFNHWILK